MKTYIDVIFPISLVWFGFSLIFICTGIYTISMSLLRITLLLSYHVSVSWLFGFIKYFLLFLTKHRYTASLYYTFDFLSPKTSSKHSSKTAVNFLKHQFIVWNCMSCLELFSWININLTELGWFLFSCKAIALDLTFVSSFPQIDGSCHWRLRNLCVNGNVNNNNLSDVIFYTVYYEGIDR